MYEYVLGCERNIIENTTASLHSNANKVTLPIMEPTVGTSREGSGAGRAGVYLVQESKGGLFGVTTIIAGV